MKDRLGNRIDIGMIVHVVGQPDIFFDDNWVLVDFLEMGIFTHYILRNCFSNEIKIFDSKDIERGL